ncbi:MAG: glycosyltransferase [Bilifractor sp.]|jgi:glycosyltransferase involved in cell wall biosynthesis
MNAAVLIPAYQPETILKDLVEKLLSYDCRVIVVDDGSGVLYQKMFQELGNRCTVLHHDVNLGKGEAIRTGLRYIEKGMEDCSVIGVMDADGQHIPDDMLRVLNRANMHPYAFVLGCRDIKKMPFRSRIGNHLTRKVFYHLYHLKISDTQTGMRAFSRSFIPRLLEVDGSRYEYEMNVLSEIARQKIPVEEVRIHTIYRDSHNSTSHFHIIRDSFLIYKKLLLFAMSSLSGFVIDYSLFAVLTLAFPKTSSFLLTANVIARVISGFCNYHINCRLVFHERGEASTAWQYFLLACGILVMNNFILTAYTQTLRIPVYIAKLLTEITLFIFSWLIQSSLIFRKKMRMQAHV